MLMNSLAISHFRTRSLLLALSICGLAPLNAGAQERRPQDEAMIILVDDSVAHSPTALLLKNASEPNATLWILRHPDGNQRNVIAIRRSAATSGLVLAGIRVLQTSQAQVGKDVPRTRQIAINVQVGEAADAPTRALFNALLHAPRINVPGLGKLQAVTINLPAAPTRSGNEPPGKKDGDRGP